MGAGAGGDGNTAAGSSSVRAFNSGVGVSDDASGASGASNLPKEGSELPPKTVLLSCGHFSRRKMSTAQEDGLGQEPLF